MANARGLPRRGGSVVEELVEGLKLSRRFFMLMFRELSRLSGLRECFGE